MATAEQELRTLKREFQTAKNEQLRLETRLDEAKKRRKEAQQKIKDKGYDPKDLPKLLKQKEAELEKTLKEAKQYLPAEDDEFDYDED